MWNTLKGAFILLQLSTQCWVLEGDLFFTALVLLLYLFLAVGYLPIFSNDKGSLIYVIPPCAAVGVSHICVVFLFSQLLLVVPVRSLWCGWS